MKTYTIQANNTREKLDTVLFSQKAVIKPTADISISYSQDPQADEILALDQWEAMSLQNPMGCPLYVYGTLGTDVKIYNNAKFLYIWGGASQSWEGSPENRVFSLRIWDTYINTLNDVIYINAVAGVNTGWQVFQTWPAMEDLA